MSEVTSKKLPVYRHHTPSGQARVRWQGREIYLGKFESPESRQRYAELLTKIVAGTMLDLDLLPRRTAKAVQSADVEISVNELCVAFLRHAEQHDRKGDEPTSEFDGFLSAIKPLKKLFGVIPVDEFGRCLLRSARQKMVENGWYRRHSFGVFVTSRPSSEGWPKPPLIVDRRLLGRRKRHPVRLLWPISSMRIGGRSDASHFS